MTDEATEAALVHLARMLSQTLQIATHCAQSLEEAGLLNDQRAHAIARLLRELAQGLDIDDEAAPHRHAGALHAIALRLEAGHPSPDQP